MQRSANLQETGTTLVDVNYVTAHLKAGGTLVALFKGQPQSCHTLVKYRDGCISEITRVCMQSEDLIIPKSYEGMNLTWLVIEVIDRLLILDSKVLVCDLPYVEVLNHEYVKPEYLKILKERKFRMIRYIARTMDDFYPVSEGVMRVLKF